jgi:multidrug efflux pump subunit AcrA (membrane-fusion protein)
MFRFAGILGRIALVVIMAAFLYEQRSYVRRETQSRVTRVEAGPHVLVVSATRGAETRSFSFVGDARPYFETTLYSKVRGYLSTINVHKGDKVAPG